VLGIEECHGGSSFGHSKETAGMKSSTPFLSTLIVSSLHLELTSIPTKDDRGKTSFPDQEYMWGITTIVKKSETKDPCVLLAENDSFLLSPLSFSLILLCI
jgi:hypothetical protein